MLVVSLDEAGKFEKINNIDPAMFIGGIVFTCNDKTAIKKELTRIEHFFKNICNEYNCEYPIDLHFNCERKNGRNVSIVKSRVTTELGDFLKGEHRWRNNKPNGIYGIYIMLADNKGINTFNIDGLSNLLQDDIASNRYEHMAYRSIENMLLFNPRINEINFRLDLATRLVCVDDNNDRNEMEDSGHEAHYKEHDKYKATDTASFRSALAAAIQNSKKNTIQIDLNVTPIKYSTDLYNNKEMHFLYLADMFCSFIQNSINEKTELNSAYSAINEACIKLVGLDNTYIWLYNEIDQAYRYAIQYLENKQYFRSIKTLYEGVISNKKYSKNYDIWVDALQQQYTNNIDINAVQASIDELYDYILNSDKPNFSLQLTRYAYDIFDKICFRTDNININKISLYKLLNINLMRYNHEGNYIEATKAYDKCTQYIEYVPIDEIIRLRNRYSVILNDSLELEKAIEFTKETLTIAKKIDDFKKNLYHSNNIININYARTLSQLGQCYSFYNDYENASKCFEEALPKFGNNYNYTTTLSYYLHAIIMNKDKENYEKYIVYYLKSTDIEEQLSHIKEMPAMEFALYVYLKALYTLYRKDIDKNIVKKVIELVNLNTKNTKSDHPWEMIYKYCAFLIYQVLKDRKTANDYMEKARICIKDPKGILKKIVDNNSAEYNQLQKSGSPDTKILSYTYR